MKTREEAIAKIKEYLNDDKDGYSAQGIVGSMVTFYGFEENQIRSVLKELNPDWNEQAVEAARCILDEKDRGYSYSGVLELLVLYRGFTNDQARYAIDRCNPSWQHQADKFAMMYLLDTSYGCSYKETIRDMLNEGFTQIQIDKAITSCNPNWNEQAVRAAKYEYSFGERTYYDVVKALENNGFSEEQANYGTMIVYEQRKKERRKRFIDKIKRKLRIKRKITALNDYNNDKKDAIIFISAIILIAIAVMMILCKF